MQKQALAQFQIKEPKCQVTAWLSELPNMCLACKRPGTLQRLLRMRKRFANAEKICVSKSATACAVAKKPATACAVAI